MAKTKKKVAVELVDEESVVELGELTVELAADLDSLEDVEVVAEKTAAEVRAEKVAANHKRWVVEQEMKHRGLPVPVKGCAPGKGLES